jgi:hypothetical protein
MVARAWRGTRDREAGDPRTRSWLREERLQRSLTDLRQALVLEEQSLLALRID